MRRISSSRPMTGSSLPCSARSVRSIVNFSSACRVSSALGSSTCWPPRSSSMAFSTAPRTAPACSMTDLIGDLSSSAASTNSSLEMYWSSRSCASLSVMFSRRVRSLLMCRSPPAPSTFGMRSMASPSCERSRLTLAPAFDSRPRTLPPCWSSSATMTCAGSMNWWSCPTASDWASASAIWNLLVNLSERIANPRAGFPANLKLALKLRQGLIFQGD